MTVTIGSQTNVPDPGSPILSPWAQDTAKKLVHTFPNSTARDAWTSPPDGAMCVTVNDDNLWQRKNGVWVDIVTVDDTGWVACTLNTGHGGSANNRRQAGMVTVNWSVSRTAAVASPTDITPFFVATAFRPVITMWTVGYVGGPAAAHRVTFNTDGTVIANAVTINAGQFFYGSISYPIPVP
jgi:hypothetical protein